MSPRLIFVDVGTHEAQEYAALFDHDRLTYIRRWLKSRRQAGRAGKSKPDRTTFNRFLGTISGLRAKRDQVFYVMVEPNARLFAKPIYRKADLALNFALAAEAGGASLRPLFLAENNPLGQGSSLFAEKPNVEQSQFDLVPSLDPKLFAQELDRSMANLYTKEPIPVVLRLNNEGAEVDVIEAFYEVFGPRLKLVMGSLNDVVKVRGQDALDALMTFLKDRQIDFIPLHSSYTTWPKAADAVAGLLER